MSQFVCFRPSLHLLWFRRVHEDNLWVEKYGANKPLQDGTG
jgi:hypothetical protein